MKTLTISWWLSWFYAFMAALSTDFAVDSFWAAIAVYFGLMAIITVVYNHD